jgi:hypothetical protein
MGATIRSILVLGEARPLLPKRISSRAAPCADQILCANAVEPHKVMEPGELHQPAAAPIQNACIYRFCNAKFPREKLVERLSTA